MHILIAPDSFKESLSALEVAEAIASGFSSVYSEATFDLLPVGDGGEGTLSSLSTNLHMTTKQPWSAIHLEISEKRLMRF